jgi:hypothetical protein
MVKDRRRNMDKVEPLRVVPMDPQVFLTQEFNALRKEIELEIKELREYLRYAIIASGAIWAWFLSHSQPQIPQLARFLPLALSALLFGQTIVVRKKVYKIGSYITKIEGAFPLPAGLGWETQLLTGGIKRDSVPFWEKAVWVVLCIGNLGAALLFR